MKNYVLRGAVVVLVLLTSVLPLPAQAVTYTQTVVLDMNSFVMPDVPNLHQGDLMKFAITNLNVTRGVWVGICNSSVIAAKAHHGSTSYIANCDQAAGSSALLSMDLVRRPASTKASTGVGLAIHTTFGTTNCLIDHCVIYVVSDSTGSDMAYTRSLPLYFRGSIQHLTMTWPSQSNIVKGTTMVVSRSSASSNQPSATIKLKSLLTTVCTVTAISGGWSVKALKLGTCKLQMTAYADALGVWLPSTSLRGYPVTAN